MQSNKGFIEKKKKGVKTPDELHSFERKFSRTVILTGKLLHDIKLLTIGPPPNESACSNAKLK
jgi:hypothetical protein